MFDFSFRNDWVKMFQTKQKCWHSSGTCFKATACQCRWGLLWIYLLILLRILSSWQTGHLLKDGMGIPKGICLYIGTMDGPSTPQKRAFSSIVDPSVHLAVMHTWRKYHLSGLQGLHVYIDIIPNAKVTELVKSPDSPFFGIGLLKMQYCLG